MKLTVSSLRRHALSSSFFPPTTPRAALRKLGFVQADPIRSPARAQDLILRHRVTGYREGDLERKYRRLDIEEDFLYAYGFMPESTWMLLHPRLQTKLTPREKRILEIVSAHKRLHPRDLESYLGKKREVNAWGGYSKATTRSLHRLHFQGWLRVVGRENGIRLYEPTRKQTRPLDSAERLKKLVLLIAGILAPLPERSLRGALQLLRYGAPHLEGRHSVVTHLIESGELAHAVVDELRYVWPAARVSRKAPPAVVRFLAPFDPLVWDRRRFEHLWGWPYRFEAYTPPPKRKLGYYAMPLLWKDDVIGCVNISRRSSTLQVTPVFIKPEPEDPAFQAEYQSEIERFRLFLA